jgi:CRP-like cAMP-binding protein
MQVAGSGERIPKDVFRKQLSGSETLRSVLLAFVQTFMVQTAHTAIANAHAKLPERLARWLLMAQDRVESDSLALTHEFLSLMLGVRRAGVTEAIQDLRKKNLIQSGRAHLTVLDRKGLERVAGDFYGVPEREYGRSLG